MIQRKYLTLPSQSFFLFGARGTGKSSWLKSQLTHHNAWYIDLLDPEEEDRFRQRPKTLESEYLAMKKKPKWIVLDEVQRVPKLLDLAHRMIENYKVKFALSGSSARKLKRGGSNLLAGRAFVNYLFPLTYQELGKKFDLESILKWGSLPKLLSLKGNEKEKYLRAYALVYLNEEIRAEQIVRNLEPFREFLRISAQHNGKILNYANISKDVGSDIKTIQSYFQILEDTWMGFHLPAYHESIRKAQRKRPKFFWFDVGVKRALEQTLDMIPKSGTSYYGDCFEHFIIAEVFRLNHYLERDFRLAYFETQNSNAEIDLVLSKGRRRPIVIEIKSTEKINEVEVTALERLAKDFNPEKIYYLSRSDKAQNIGSVLCRPWKAGLDEIFGL